MYTTQKIIGFWKDGRKDLLSEKEKKKFFKEIRKLTTKGELIIYLYTDVKVWKTNVQNTCTINSQGRKDFGLKRA